MNTELIYIIEDELKSLRKELALSNGYMDSQAIMRDIDHFEEKLAMVKAARRNIALSEINYPAPL